MAALEAEHFLAEHGVDVSAVPEAQWEPIEAKGANPNQQSGAAPHLSNGSTIQQPRAALAASH